MPKANRIKIPASDRRHPRRRRNPATALARLLGVRFAALSPRLPAFAMKRPIRPFPTPPGARAGTSSLYPSIAPRQRRCIERATPAPLMLVSEPSQQRVTLGAIGLAFDALRRTPIDHPHYPASTVMLGDHDGERIRGRAEDRA